MARDARPAPDRPREPLPRPARPLRRARAPRRRVGRDGRRARRPQPARPQRGRPARRRPRPRPRAPPRDGVTYFGIEDPSQALPGLQHAHDAKHCRRCGAPYAYERAFVGHLGHYTCPNCGADRPAPDIAATAIRLDGMRGSEVDITTPAGPLRPPPPPPRPLQRLQRARRARRRARPRRGSRAGVAGLERVEAAFGRVETVEVGSKQVSILLIKNPAGANEVLRTLVLEAERDGGGVDLWIALNDRIADGRDVSWVWDADFELLAGAVRRVTCAGTRAPEMAVRLKYAGVDPALISVQPEIAASLDEAVAAAPGRLFALPTYTALLELRTLLVRSRPGEGVLGMRAMRDEAVIWHDVECGAYATDLPLWRELRRGRLRARPRDRLRHRPGGARPRPRGARRDRSRQRPGAGRGAPRARGRSAVSR